MRRRSRLQSILVIATLYLFEITLTLPGIAGIILSIGMAVDANVIIFARIREEIAGGKPVGSAMDTGFKKALSAIIDGNVTTLIAAAVLGVFGSGTVKGFASTLAIGIILSMFTALVITRLILNSLYAVGLKDQKYFGKGKVLKTLHLIERKAVLFGISIVIIVAGFVAMGVYGSNGNALNYSLDFIGGTSTTIPFEKDYTIKEIESDMVPLVEGVTGDSDIQTTQVQGTNQIIFKTRTLSLDEREALNQAFIDKYKVDEKEIQSESISSAVSSEMRADACYESSFDCRCMYADLYLVPFQRRQICSQCDSCFGTRCTRSSHLLCSHAYFCRKYVYCLYVNDYRLFD